MARLRKIKDDNVPETISKFTKHRVVILLNNVQSVVQRDVVGTYFVMGIGSCVLHTRHAKILKKIQGSTRNFEGIEGELLVSLGNISSSSKGNRPLMMKLFVHGTQERTLCSNDCNCYKRIREFDHSERESVVFNSQYCPGRNYEIFGFGKCGFNPGKIKQDCSCLLVNFDGHLLWVSNTFISQIQFYWSDFPELETTLKSVLNISQTNASKKMKSSKTLFSSISDITESFVRRPFPPIDIELESALGYDSSFFTVQPQTEPISYVVKAPLVYSIQQKKFSAFWPKQDCTYGHENALTRESNVPFFGGDFNTPVQSLAQIGRIETEETEADVEDEPIKELTAMLSQFPSETSSSTSIPSIFRENFDDSFNRTHGLFSSLMENFDSPPFFEPPIENENELKYEKENKAKSSNNEENENDNETKAETEAERERERETAVVHGNEELFNALYPSLSETNSPLFSPPNFAVEENGINPPILIATLGSISSFETDLNRFKKDSLSWQNDLTGNEQTHLLYCTDALGFESEQMNNYDSENGTLQQSSQTEQIFGDETDQFDDGQDDTKYVN